MHIKNLLFSFLFISCFSYCGSERVAGPSPENPEPEPERFLYFQDQDADGFGDPEVSIEATLQPVGYVENSQDCDDQNSEVYPGSRIHENSNGLIDFNCDGIYYFLATETHYVGAKATRINSYDNLRESLERVDEAEISVELIFFPDQPRFIQRVFNTAQNREIGGNEFIFDARGNVLTYRIYEGLIDLADILYSERKSYNLSDQIISAQYRSEAGLNKNVRRAYDNRGNLLSITEFEGALDRNVSSVRRYSYDADDNLIRAESFANGNTNTPVTQTIVYTYDLQGNNILVQRYDGAPDEAVESAEVRTYDANGFVNSLKIYQTRQDVLVVTFAERYTNDEHGNHLILEAFEGDFDTPRVQAGRYTYNERGQILTSKIFRNADFNNDVASSRRYTYDARGNQISRKDFDGDLDTVVTFSERATFNENGQELSFERFENDFDSNIVESRFSTYDANGLKLSYQEFRDMELLSERYSYDANGNRLSREVFAGTIEENDLIFSETVESYWPITYPIAVSESPRPNLLFFP